MAADVFILLVVLRIQEKTYCLKEVILNDVCRSGVTLPHVDQHNKTVEVYDWHQKMHMLISYVINSMDWWQRLTIIPVTFIIFQGDLGVAIGIVLHHP